MGTGQPPTRAPRGDRAAPPSRLPAGLHRASRSVLDAWTVDDLSLAEFRRVFSLPNSGYLPIGECLAALYRVDAAR